MNYDYVGYTPEKKLVKGSVAAPDEEGAIEILASYGYKILKLVPVKSFKPNWERLFPSFFKVKPDEIIVFSRQLTLLTEAGTDLVAAIKLLQRQVSNKVLRRALGAIVSDIRSGTRVADAMGKYPDIFSKIYCRSVRVGEQTGELGMMLTQIADYMENESVGRKGLKSAMTYPIVVSVVAVGVVILLVNFVLPTFESLYLTLGADLPMITRIFLDVAGGFRSYGIYLLVVLATAFGTCAFYFRTPSGKYTLDKLTFRLPLIGLINRLRQLAYCCRTMAVLFRSGLSSTEIMDILVEDSSNRVMMEALNDVKQAMLKGEGLSKPMSDNQLFLPMMVEMVRVGEETGGLGDTLVIVAKTFDAEADSKTHAFTRFVSTSMTIAISIGVTVVVVAMLSAMYGIYGQMS